jgi:hypothetical protein
MPLSEQEQRLLEEMERSLYHNDADFVATVPVRRGRPNYTVVTVGILVGILGVAVLVTGVIVHQPLVGVLGFAVMFAGVLIAVTPPRQSMTAPEARGRKATERSTSFMQSMNERWDKRQDERDQ